MPRIRFRRTLPSILNTAGLVSPSAVPAHPKKNKGSGVWARSKSCMRLGLLGSIALVTIGSANAQTVPVADQIKALQDQINQLQNALQEIKAAQLKAAQAAPPAAAAAAPAPAGQRAAPAAAAGTPPPGGGVQIL